MSNIPTSDLESLIQLFHDNDWQEMHFRADSLELFLSKDPSRQRSSTNPRPITDASNLKLMEEREEHADRQPPPQKQKPERGPPTEKEDRSHENTVVIRAPSLGTFYRAPKPGAATFCEVGQKVSEDSELCLIEVMKLFTTVRAGQKGIVREICVNDGEMVEFDQPLFVIEL